MNFTKYYIDLCKNSKVRSLRENNVIYKGDMHIDESGFVHVAIREYHVTNMTWLPTGDQLDDEIVKICSSRSFSYNFSYPITLKNFYVEIEDGAYVIYSFHNSNPLIAKISLLIKLLEAAK